VKQKPLSKPKPEHHLFLGVSYCAPKKKPRAKFKGMENSPEISEQYKEALSDSEEYLLNGEKSLADRVTSGYYYATIFVQGKARYLGKTTIARNAATLYDAALFHLWRFIKNPRRKNFNFYRGGQPIPIRDARLDEVIAKIEWELREQGIEPDAVFTNYYNIYYPEHESWFPTPARYFKDEEKILRDLTVEQAT
jgi:hypothetical protein